MTSYELHMVRRMLEDGETYRQIGKTLDRDHSGIAKQAKRNGWRSLRGPHGRHPTLQELQV
jgi:IS30 family transposase